MHLIDTVIERHQIGEDIYTMGWTLTVCNKMITHDDMNGLKTVTKDGSKVTCEHCVLRMLGRL